MAARGDSDGEDSMRLITFLDEAEKRVESFRSQATYMMQEKPSLLMVLQQLKEESLKCTMSDGDRQQFLANAERLGKRCESVLVEVNTVRNESQEKALDKVNNILEELKSQMKEHPEKHQKQLELYHNTCQSDCCGAVDARFQSLVLECTVDDQKELRHRLESWLRSTKELSNGKL